MAALAKPTSIRYAAWTLVLTSLACADPDPSSGGMCTTTLVERDLVRFYLFEWQPEEVCAASFDAVAAHVPWVADAWGSDPSEVDYGFFGSRQDPCWGCSAGAGACGRDGILSTTRIPDRHETAHAARGTNCTGLIEEGWATLYANPFEDGEMVGTLRGAVLGIEQTNRLAGEHYPLAARFVAYLLDTHGIEAVRELCTITLASEAQLDAALQQVLGASLDETQLALDEYPAWTLGALRQDQACDDTDVLLSPTTATLGLGCMADGVEGTLGGRAWSHRLVELPESGVHDFRFETSQAAELWMELRSCDRAGMASTFYSTMSIHPKPDTPAAFAVELPAGVYVLRLMVLESQASDLSVEISIES